MECVKGKAMATINRNGIQASGLACLGFSYTDHSFGKKIKIYDNGVTL